MPSCDAMKCLAALALVACTVEHRKLRPEATPPLGVVEAAGGSVSTDMPDDGDSGGTPAAGGDTAAQGGAPASEAPQATTTATSWSFDTEADIDAWQPDDGIEQSFDTEDADGNGDSGSLLVSAASAGASDEFVSIGTSVCVPVRGGASYDVAVDVEIDDGQGVGSGGFTVEFLDGAACDGTPLGFAHFLTATTGSWLLGETTATAPDSARSAQFRLVVSKPGSAAAFAVRFDDARFGGP